MKFQVLAAFLWKVARLFLPGIATPSLQALADRYEEELTDRTFVYTFKPKGKKAFTAPVVFDRAAFCHLFSIGSLAKGSTPDLGEFSGMKGWRNIQSGKISFSMLKRMNPTDFAYYQPEYELIEQMIETVHNPDAVVYDGRKVPGSKLEADILLYRIVGNRTIHIAICPDRDGTWFARSYFVRDNNRDREYPSRYIAGMDPLTVKVKVSSKNA